MSEMFCFQCEQTAGGKGCTHGGVCGKKPEAAQLQDEITAGLVTLARAASGKPACPKVEAFFMDALFMTVTNVNFDTADLTAMRDRILRAVEKNGGAPAFNPGDLFHGNPDIVSLRSTLLFGLRGYPGAAKDLAQDAAIRFLLQGDGRRAFPAFHRKGHDNRTRIAAQCRPAAEVPILVGQIKWASRQIFEHSGPPFLFHAPSAVNGEDW